MTEVLGYNIVGTGSVRLILLNDWMSDTTSWDMCRPLIDKERCSWAFVDLRGYGRSRTIPGVHTLSEAAADVLRTADALGWERFAVVGHSMSSLIALHLAQIRPERIDRVVVIAPPPPAGLGADDATLNYLRGVALGDSHQRVAGLEMMWGDRLSPGWTDFKAARWQDTADPHAAADYVDMFARHGLPHPGQPIHLPVLAITGEQDAEVMRADAVRRLISPLCKNLLVQPIAESSHYPMQEAPPLTHTYVERFVALTDSGT
jgi:3-oxoadipate enol-lactonase